MCYEALNQTLLTQKYWGLPPDSFYGQEAYGIQQEEACLKIIEFFH